jgi:Fe-S-cluster containining protein
MPDGKPAGVRCIHLTESHRCAIYERRPDVCAQFTPTAEFCGASFPEAVQLLSRAELMTRPDN